MYIPTARKLESGNWFIYLRLGGENIPITEPSEKQCIKTAQHIKAEYLDGKREKVSTTNLTLKQAINNYIDSRESILSPSTVRGYCKIRDNRFAPVIDRPLKGIKDWQAVCNEEAKKCSAKTLKNGWFFVASVLRFSGYPVPEITLPQVVVRESPYLEPDQIPIFIDAIKRTSCEIPALVALHSFRRSEVCAMDFKDIDLVKDRIKTNGSAVFDKHDKMVIKETNKNTTSNRYTPILIPRLKDAILEHADRNGKIVSCCPNTLKKQIDKICEDNDLPKVGVHGLRHSFASLCYHLGVPEKIAMQIGGWKDPTTMHKIYTHLAQKDVDKYGDELRAFFNNANGNANKNS